MNKYQGESGSFQETESEDGLGYLEAAKEYWLFQQAANMLGGGMSGSGQTMPDFELHDPEIFHEVNCTYESDADINPLLLETIKVQYDSDGDWETIGTMGPDNVSNPTEDEMVLVKRGGDFYQKWNANPDIGIEFKLVFQLDTGTSYSSDSLSWELDIAVPMAGISETYSADEYVVADNIGVLEIAIPSTSAILADNNVFNYLFDEDANNSFMDLLDISLKIMLSSTDEMLLFYSKLQGSEIKEIVKYTDVVLGDINLDGNYNVLDVVALANCVIAEDCPESVPVPEACDMNGDTYYNVLDIVALSLCVLAEDCLEQYG